MQSTPRDGAQEAFQTVSKTMPETNIHRGDEEFGGKQSHSYYHNVYGMLQARSTYEGMLLADENKRPFVLTRAAFIGAHRSFEFCSEQAISAVAAFSHPLPQGTHHWSTCDDSRILCWNDPKHSHSSSLFITIRILCIKSDILRPNRLEATENR